jgi:hypothetical protein
LHYKRFHSFYGEKIFSIEASSSYRHVGYTKGMGTTDFTDVTDEDRAGGSFRHWGGCKAFFISFFISGISVIRGRSPLVLVAAERSEAALGDPWLTSSAPIAGEHQ